jgi:hypothetical protein
MIIWMLVSILTTSGDKENGESVSRVPARRPEFIHVFIT